MIEWLVSKNLIIQEIFLTVLEYRSLSSKRMIIKRYFHINEKGSIMKTIENKLNFFYILIYNLFYLLLLVFMNKFFPEKLFFQIAYFVVLIVATYGFLYVTGIIKFFKGLVISGKVFAAMIFFSYVTSIIFIVPAMKLNNDINIILMASISGLFGLTLSYIYKRYSRIV